MTLSNSTGQASLSPKLLGNGIQKAKQNENFILCEPSRWPVYHPAAQPGIGGLASTSTWHRSGGGSGKRFWQTGSPGLPDDFPSPHAGGKPAEALAGVGGPGDRAGGPGSRAGAVQVRLLDQKQRARAVVVLRAPRRSGVGVPDQASSTEPETVCRLDLGHLGP